MKIKSGASPEKKHRVFVSRLLLILVTMLTIVMLASLVTRAQVFDQLSKPTSSSLKTSLQEGKVVLNGSDGEYTCQVIIRGSLTSIWSVLTDYEHYKDFMPNVVESHLLQNRHNEKVFEQIQVFKILIAEKKVKVKLAMTENYPKEIKFRVIEGNVKSLKGSWQIEAVSSNLFMLTNQVFVEPNIKSSFDRNLFFTIYEDTLENTLTAVKQESEKRSHSH